MKDLTPITSSASVQNIFQTMAYNESQVNDFSPILSWLAPHKNKLTSIVNGVWTESCSSPPHKDDYSFSIGESRSTGTKVVLDFASPDLLDKTLTHLPPANHASKNAKETSVEETEREKEGRLSKLKNLLDTLRSQLSLAETIATQIPTWQIVEYDQPNWNHQMSCSTTSLSSSLMYLPGSQVIQPRKTTASTSGKGEEAEATVALVLVHVSRQGYSLEKLLSTILIPAIQFDGKFILTMSLSSAQDSSSTLPIAYLIDAVNKSKIRKEPIDLLLLDRSCEKSLEVLRRKSNTCKIYVRSDVETSHHLPLHLLSGVFTPTKGTGGVHFILDSSADVQTAVEAISVNVWTSGTKVNARPRSLLFVHQSVHKAVIESVKKKMSQLKTGTDLSLKMVDFIKRSNPSILPQGVKVFPENSDLTLPTLVYEMGTSCDLIASPVSGLGHVLVVIPYRNTAELVSLSNNFDHQNQVFIYTSDLTFFKSVTSQLNAKDMWANTSQTNSRASLETFISQAVVREDEITEKITLTKADLDKFSRVQTGAEKSLKLWSSTRILERFEKLENLLSSLVQSQEPYLRDGDKLEYFTTLLAKAAGHLNTSGSGSSASNLSMQMCQPIGSLGLLLIHPERLNFLSKIIPICLSALKGNVTTVLVVPNEKTKTEAGGEGGGEEDLIKNVQNSFDSFLPPGVVNFMIFPTLSQAVQVSSGQHSQFNLLWVIHDGDGVGLNQVSVNAFHRLILDTQFTLSSPLLRRAQLLEFRRTIHI